MHSSPFVALLALPREAIWSYSVGGLVLAIGLATIVLRGGWRKARGVDRVILFGPLCYAAPLAAFGTEHFTITNTIASMIPSWMPWHVFWAYFVGAGFVAAGFSIVTGVLARVSASLVALTFVIFVVLIDAPGWMSQPANRFALALTLRELTFSGGALALAASLTDSKRTLLATIARYFVAIPIVVYSVEQFLHPEYVPAVPLKFVTPAYVYGHAIWTYVAAAVYAVGGVLLLAGKRTRVAAAGVGAIVLLIVVVVYVPVAIVNHATLVGLNFVGDTLMYGGAVLLLAGAMPRKT